MTSGQPNRILLTRVGVADGQSRDVLIEGERIAQVAPWGTIRRPDLTTLDLDGYVLLPAPAEPHAHLDKALLGTRQPNETEDLAGAITAIAAAYDTMDRTDTLRRATEAIRQAVLHGFTAIRTHVDCRAGIGSRSVRVLAELREQLAGRIDLQLVALAGPVAGVDGREERELLVESLRCGADLVGGVPTLEQDSPGSVRELLAIAVAHGADVDVHVDETLDPGARVLRMLAERVIDTGFPHRVTASHCVSLSTQPLAEIRETAARVAEARIGVVALPQTNLYLQGRTDGGASLRGIAPIQLLRAAGVTVAGGGDNWRDPFNPMGRIDALETASLLVAAGHQRVADAYASVSADARAVMGLEPVEIAVGAEASLIAVRGESLSEAVGRGSEDRVVFSKGVLLARTEVRTTFAAGWPGDSTAADRLRH